MLVFPGEAKPGPARDEDPHVGSSTEQIGHERSSVEDVLVIVQNEQEAPLAQECLEPSDERFIARIAHAEDVGDGGRNQIGMGDRRETDEADAIRIILGKPSGDGKGESGLAYAARPGQGKQPHIRPTRELNERRNLSLTADKRREREGEWRHSGSACGIDHSRPDRSDDPGGHMIMARTRNVNDRETNTIVLDRHLSQGDPVLPPPALRLVTA